MEGMIPGLPAALGEGIAATAAGQPGLSLVLVFGSRARGDASPGSDWDLGYCATPDVDPASLLADLVGLLGSDRIDLVDLDRASAQLRFRAASEGRVLYQADPEAFAGFWMAAVSFWCDAGPLLRAGYEDVLARLPK